MLGGEDRALGLSKQALTARKSKDVREESPEGTEGHLGGSSYTITTCPMRILEMRKRKHREFKPLAQVTDTIGGRAQI